LNCRYKQGPNTFLRTISTILSGAIINNFETHGEMIAETAGLICMSQSVGGSTGDVMDTAVSVFLSKTDNSRFLLSFWTVCTSIRPRKKVSHASVSDHRSIVQSTRTAEKVIRPNQIVAHFGLGPNPSN
jgi:hypothetical protein